jgi:hypothetical protein
MEGSIFLKRAVIDLQRLPTEVGETLRRLSAVGETRRVNDLLRAEGVDSLRFTFTPDGECRITSDGLARVGVRQPTLAVEARIRVLPSSGTQNQAKLELRVGGTRRTWAKIAGWPILVAAILAWRMGYESLLTGGFWGLLLFIGCLPSGVYVLQLLALMRRVWPGLLAEARRMADGSLEEPAA